MKKSRLWILLFVMLTSVVARANEEAGELQGTGSENYPYVIESMWDIYLLRQRLESGKWRDKYKDKYFILTCDLHFNSNVLDSEGRLRNNGEGLDEWLPIGRDDYYRSFQSHFDGQGHTVYGLYVNTEDKDAGFFGYMNDGSVKNLNFQDCYVKGKETAGIVVGRFSKGEVRDCNVQGLVEIEGSTYQAGLVAGNGDDIAGCRASGRVSAKTVADEYGYAWNCSVGGVCGAFDWISQCSSSAEVTASGWCSIGGVAGSGRSINESINNGIVRTDCGTGIGGVVGSATWVGRCENRGMVYAQAKGARIGGISGSCTGNSTISESINHISFNISGDSIGVGGIVAYPEADRYTSVKIKDCINFGDIEVTGENSYGGGIAGRSYAASYFNCINYGNVTIPDNDAAGIVSYATYHSNAYGCENYGNVATRKRGGGIMGYSADGIVGCANFGKITGIDEDAILGGIVGRCESSSCFVKYSYNLGDVSHGDYNGGIVGSANWGGGMYSCYNSGKIEAYRPRAWSGGLAGYAGFSIRDCYNTGDVVAEGDGSITGGLAGKVFVGNSQWSTLRNCFNMGNVLSVGANSYAGSLIGSHGDWGSYDTVLKNCFYLENTVFGSGYTDDVANDSNSGRYAHKQTLADFKNLVEQLDVPDYYDYMPTAHFEQGLYHPVLKRYDEYSDETNPQSLAWKVTTISGDTVKIDLGRAFANTLLYTDTTSVISIAPNVIDKSNNSINKLELSEYHDFMVPENTDEIKVSEIRYRRLSDAGCQTLVLPFGIQVPSGLLAWSPVKFEDGVLYCEESLGIEAGRPYIIIRNSSENESPSIYGLDLEGEGLKLTGDIQDCPFMASAFIRYPLLTDMRYYLPDNGTSFYPIENLETSIPFMPMAIAPASEAYSEIKATIDPFTGVSDMNKEQSETIDVFDINGIRIASGLKYSDLKIYLSPGFYILSDGRRIVIGH